MIGCLIAVWADEFSIEFSSTGSTTLKREDLLKGVESHKGYYIKNEELMRGADELDLTQDPPAGLGGRGRYFVKLRRPPAHLCRP